MMKISPLIVLLLALQCLAISPTQGQDAKQKKEAEEPVEMQSMIVRLGGHDARDVTEMIVRIFGREVQVTPMSRQSMLVVRYPAELREKITAMIKETTPELSLIRLRLMLLRSTSPLSGSASEGLEGKLSAVQSAVKKLADSNRATVFHDVEVTVLQDTQTQFQTGKRIANASGSIRSSGGREQIRYEWTEVGTILSVQAKPAGDNSVLMDLNFEKSFLEPAATSEEGTSAPRSVSTLTQQSTARVDSGNAQIIARMSSGSEGDSTSYLLIAAATIL